MAKKIEITCLNDKKKYNISPGIDLFKLADIIKPKVKHRILGAKINNELQELSYEVFKPKHVRFLDITDPDGQRMYVRSLSFILIKAFREIFPKASLKIAHSISNGLYCEIEGLGGVIYDDDVLRIKERMKEIVLEDIPFERREIVNSEAIEIFKDNNLDAKYKLFKNRTLLYTSVYNLGETIDYFYGYLVPSSGYINVFDLEKYHEGMLLRFPSSGDPDVLTPKVKQDKMFDIFREHKLWAKILGVANVGSLNEMIEQGRIGEIIKVSEALHEKKIGQIADNIYKDHERIRLVLISGPSSSGKTSFCKRLSVQLRVLGLNTFQVSMDDFFVDREETPRDENGDFDFECLEAIDVKLFNKVMLDLMAGKKVSLPRFDFASGTKSFKQEKVQVDQDTVFIVEGIHGLNPGLTKMISNDLKYKIYVSALTQISIDSHNRIPTTDNRLIRRMVRDYKYRGYSGLDTINRWPSVRRGEEKNIFPYQEMADAMFNSAMLYEIAYLKKHALPVLTGVPENKEAYSEARRLIKFLSYFSSIPSEHDFEIPPTSIIREFIGGSSFDY